jgi:hypothetical protein
VSRSSKSEKRGSNHGEIQQHGNGSNQFLSSMQYKIKGSKTGLQLELVIAKKYTEPSIRVVSHTAA